MSQTDTDSRTQPIVFSLLALTRDVVWQLREVTDVQIVLDANQLLPSICAQRHAVAFALHTLLAEAVRHVRGAVRVRLFVFERELVTLINLPGMRFDDTNAALRHSERLLARQGTRLIFSSGTEGTGLRFSFTIANDAAGD